MASTLEKIKQKAQEAKNKRAVSGAGGQMIPLDKIDFDEEQPRQDFYTPDGVIDPAVQESLADLAASMKINGQQAEITVIEQETGRYKIAVGERRVRAALLNGWTEIRANIRNDLTGTKLMLYRLSENVDREDLSELDTARYIASIVSAGGMKKHEIASHFGKKPAWVTRYLAFADDSNYQKWVKPGYIVKAWILYAVLQLPEDVQAEIYSTCQARGPVEITSQELRHYESIVRRGVPLSTVNSNSDSEQPGVPQVVDPAMSVARAMMKADTSEERDAYEPPATLSPKNAEKHSEAHPRIAALRDENGESDTVGTTTTPSTHDAMDSSPSIVTAQLSVAQLSAILVALQKKKAEVSSTMQSLAVNFRLPEAVVRDALAALGEGEAHSLPPLVLGLKLAEAGHKLVAKK